jgi:hypothetical protein
MIKNITKSETDALMYEVESTTSKLLRVLTDLGDKATITQCQQLQASFPMLRYKLTKAADKRPGWAVTRSVALGRTTY